MIDTSDVFISLHRLICISLCSCLLACLYPRILTSSYSQIHVPFACIPSSSYSQVGVCLLVTAYPHIIYPQAHLFCVHVGTLVSHILISLCHVLRVRVDIPASSHLHILRFMYSSCLFLSLHPLILISLGSCAPGTCWYPRIFISSCPQVHVLWVLVDILACSYSQVYVLQVLVDILAPSHPHTSSINSCLETWNQIKTMVLMKKNSVYGKN